MPVPMMMDAGREDSGGCCSVAEAHTAPPSVLRRHGSARPRCVRATQSDPRPAYFSQAGAAAARYGVNFERVLAHLRAARARHPHLAIPVMNHMDDLVHAVACVDGNDPAWRDLVDAYERGLIRACRDWMEATDAIVLVRRLFAELRRQLPGLQPLSSYDGTCPLRKWLADRVIGRLNQVDGGFARRGVGGSGLTYAVTSRIPAEG